MIKKIAAAFAVLIFLVAGAIAYTLPAIEDVLESRSDRLMSDGTDLTTNPFQFDLIHQGFKQNPHWFFFGGFPNSRLNAPEGFVSWYSFSEKLAGIVFPSFAPAEQTTTLFSITLMILNGAAFYAMARAFGWNRLLSLALSCAWAFSAYTRARAQVHASLVGTYPIPLLVLGLLILHRDRSRKSVALAALCFLGCATAPHYYIIFLALFAPFFIWFYFSKNTINFKDSLKSLLLAALPAVLLLGFSILKPAPSDFARHVPSVLPETGKANTWPHPFLEVFSARPRDYFSGDIAIGVADWNPLRAELTENIRKDPSIGNFHEHAVGIRWVIWLAFLLSVGFFIHAAWKRKRLEDSRSFWIFLCLGIFTFLASLPPDWGLMWGPSAWIHRVVEQIRVPSRMAIFVHFSILVIVGLAAHAWLSTKKLSPLKLQVFSAAFLLAVILDMPPGMNDMPQASIVPSRSDLVAAKPGNCGLGMHFPHASGSHNTLVFYYLLQSLRGTDCAVLNPATVNERDIRMTEKFGYNQVNSRRIIQNDPQMRRQLLRFALCNKLDWIVFDSQVPGEFTQDFCREFGGQMLGRDFCRSQTPVAKVAYGQPDQCLAQVE